MKHILVLIAFVLVNLQVGCKSSRLSDHTDLYSIDYFQIPDRTPKLVIEAYDYQDRNQRESFAADINGVILIGEGAYNVEPVEVYAAPGKFNISVKYLGKQTVKIDRLKIQRGDSVRVKVFMKIEEGALH